MTFVRSTLLVTVLALIVALPWADPAQAVAEVDLEARVVAVQGSTLTVTVDHTTLDLDVSAVDPRFLAVLRPGDDVRVTAFRLDDGRLVVYNVFLQVDGGHENRSQADSSDQ